MRYYYCRRLGHITFNCREKKIDFIYARLIEDLKKNDEEKEERIEKGKKSKEKQNL